MAACGRVVAPTSGNREEPRRAAQLRAALVARLRSEGLITAPEVAAAFRAVPRHRFLPAGTPLSLAYDASDPVAVKRDESGVLVSSISAPAIQARMLEQAHPNPGARVLEIGSGGYNAALLAELVGAAGRVVTVDIDPEITGRAKVALAATGYHDRVAVLRADATTPALVTALAGAGDAGTGGASTGDAAPARGAEPFDAIVVTVAAWDIAPVWLELLAATGTLVVPLLLGGATRSIGFVRAGDHLVSESVEPCAFVAMRGGGAHPDHPLRLPRPDGGHLWLHFDTTPLRPGQLADPGTVRRARIAESWSRRVLPYRASPTQLHLWCAGFLRGFCRVEVAAATGPGGERPGTWLPFGTVVDDGFAYLVSRPAGDGTGREFGARGWGPGARRAAATLVAEVERWQRWRRDGEPRFGYFPAGVAVPAADARTAVLPKTHGVVTMTWPS